MDDKTLLSKDKITVDIAKLERNLNQVSHISFEGKEKEVYDRAVDYWNDSKYYLEKEEIKIRKQFAENGLEITELTPEQLEVFKEKVKPLREELKKKYGEEACKAFRIDMDKK